MLLPIINRGAEACSLHQDATAFTDSFAHPRELPPRTLDPGSRQEVSPGARLPSGPRLSDCGKWGRGGMVCTRTIEVRVATGEVLNHRGLSV